MSTHLYLVRHGQSLGNVIDAFLGHTDLDLSELGYRQADLASDYLTSLSPTRIYASDLLRAYHTSLPTAEKCGLTVEKREELREIFAGEWEGLIFSDLATRYAEDFTKWRTDIGNSAPTGGESVKALHARVYNELLRITKENEGGRVLVFLHATPVRAVSACLSGLGFDRMCELPWPSNASCTHILYEGGEFSLVEYSRDDYLGEFSTALPKTV